MNLHEAVRKSADAFLTMDDLGLFVAGAEREILYGAAKAALKDAATERLAWQLADFVPLAFARAILTEMKVQLHDHYVRVDGEGRLRTYRRLTDEPVFAAAGDVVMEYAGREGDALLKVARHSVELQTVNAALHAGSRAADLRASPPVLGGPDDLCDPLDAAPTFAERPWWMDSWKPPPRPWWKFW